MKVSRECKRGDLYSSWKVVHLRDKLASLERGELISPQHLQVDLTGRCNNDCIFCYYRHAGFTHLRFVPTEEIPVEIGTKLFDEMADLGIPALELTGGGEPLLYPAIREVLDRISKRDLELSLVTNGSLFTKTVLDRVTHPKWIRFSIDAATAKTYSAVHQVPNKFDVVLKNLQRLIDNGFRDCAVGVSFIIQPENYSEIIAATDLFEEMGADNIRFSYAYTAKYDNLLTRNQRKEVNLLLSEAKKRESKGFKVFVMDTRLDDFAPAEKTFAFCGYQMFTFQIGCDGLAYPCCLTKYNKNFAFGDIKKESLKEIVFGEHRRKYIEGFDVEKCPPCWLRHKNEFIEYLLVQNPPHVNFV